MNDLWASMRYVAIAGIELASITSTLTWIGHSLDQRWQSTPVGTMVGAFLGLACSIALILKLKKPFD